MSDLNPPQTQTVIGPLPAAPRIYANGIAVGYSATECVLTFQFGNEPLISVILPFPFARVLSEQTTQVVTDFERRSGQKIKRPEEIIADAKLVQASGK